MFGPGSGLVKLAAGLESCLRQGKLLKDHRFLEVRRWEEWG